MRSEYWRIEGKLRKKVEESESENKLNKQPRCDDRSDTDIIVGRLLRMTISLFHFPANERKHIIAWSIRGSNIVDSINYAVQ